MRKHVSPDPLLFLISFSFLAHSLTKYHKNKQKGHNVVDSSYAKAVGGK